MRSINLTEYRETAPDGEWYIGTARGVFLVAWVDAQYWVGTKEGNGGFGQSFCCHGNDTLYSTRNAAQQAHDDYTKKLNDYMKSFETAQS